MEQSSSWFLGRERELFGAALPVVELGVPRVFVVGADELAARPLAAQRAEGAVLLVQGDLRRRQDSLHSR